MNYVGYTLLALGLLHAVQTFLKPLNAFTYLGDLKKTLTDLQRIHQNKKHAHKQFPFFVDLCALSLASGMELFQSMQEIVLTDPSHPLSQEIQRLLTHIQMGIPPQEALSELSQRLNHADASQFCQTVSQAIELGSPLSDCLGLLSKEIYSQRLYRAEALIQKMPVKLLFPLLLLILPVFMLIFIPMFLQF